MINKSLIIILQILFLPFYFGQTPYHFFLGKEEFSSIDIYDIHQDKEDNYWFATNNSLYKYDGYNYKQYFHPLQLSNSLFNIIEDKQGNVYCNNLNGQIFKVLDNEMELFHKVPDSLLTAFTSTVIDDNDNLIVHAKNLYKINIESSKIKTLIEEDLGHNHLAVPFKSSNGNIYLNYWQDSIIILSNGKISSVFLDWHRYKNSSASSFNFQEVHDKLLLENVGQELYEIDTSNPNVWGINQFYQQTKELTRIYNSADGLWLAKNTSGVHFYDLRDTLTLTKETPLLFSKHFISSVFQDKQKNILLSTFGEGIIVIPNTKASNILNNDKVKISQFAVSKDKTLYIGGFNGVIYKYNENGLDSLVSSGFKRIELLELIDNDKSLVFDQSTSLIYNLSDKTSKEIFASGSVKNIKQLDSLNYIIASNEYCIKFNINQPDYCEKIYSGRCYAVEPISNNEILLATSTGLLHIVENNIEQLKYNGNSLLVSSISKFDKKLLIGTKKQGLLEWNGTVLSPYLSIENGLSSNSINDIQSWKNYLFILTENYIEIFDQSGNYITYVSTSDGLSEPKVNRFRIIENELWCHHSTGLQKIQLENLIAKKYLSTIKSLILLINNHKQEGDQKLFFEHFENKVKFQINASNLERQSDLSYEFKLEPIENSWNYQPYAKNIIDYKTLPPGDYKFKMNLLYKGEIQDAKIIEFRIDFPFWQKWWFFALFGGIILAISYLFYKQRLKIQNKKATQINELNTSKLAAIQSQMNPHFIFNSMNSIQDLVLKGDIDNSYTFITKFSNLVRRTLSYSDKEFIDFEQEIKLIELYLSLEKLRFKDSLTYEITNTDFEDIMVPPMLIQPFIENALLHGLLHKSGEKKLTIHFELKEQLICTITDNGIGREKSNEIRQRQRADHESFSSNAIKNRFEILERYFGGSLGFEFEDLKENGIPIGTKVTIRIPVKFKF